MEACSPRKMPNAGRSMLKEHFPQSWESLGGLVWADRERNTAEKLGVSDEVSAAQRRRKRHRWCLELHQDENGKPKLPGGQESTSDRWERGGGKVR